MSEELCCVVTYAGDRPKMVSASMTHAEAEATATKWREMLDDRVEIIPAFEGLAIKRKMTSPGGAPEAPATVTGTVTATFEDPKLYDHVLEQRREWAEFCRELLEKAGTGIEDGNG